MTLKGVSSFEGYLILAMHSNGAQIPTISIREIRDVRVSNVCASGENEFEMQSYRKWKMNQSGEI